MNRSRLLIIAKTYPTLSATHVESVTSIGLREDGSWARIYPVAFERLNEQQPYDVFDWIDCELVPNHTDARSDSYHLVDIDIPAVWSRAATWQERRRYSMSGGRYRTFASLHTAMAKPGGSLAIFKPENVTDFVCEASDEDWHAGRLADMRLNAAKTDLFEEQWQRTAVVLRPMPFRFSYRVRDADGQELTLPILDWDLAATYWRAYRAGGESGGRNAVIAAYSKPWQFDLHLCISTARGYDSAETNAWQIVGVLPFPLIGANVAQPEEAVAASSGVHERAVEVEAEIGVLL